MSATALLAVQTVTIAILGAATGSFLNVVILRTKNERSWLRGRSACPHCGRQLRWWELIPVGSFLALGGRCRRCRRRLSLQYLIVECVTAAVFAMVFLRFGWTWETPVAMVIAASMIMIAVYDGRWALIPDSFSWLFVGSTTVWAALQYRQWLAAVIGLGLGLVFFGLQYWLSRGRWLGSGDIFLGAGLGLLLGWQQLLTALILAYLAGAMVAATRIIARRLTARSTMAFGPYLMAGGLAAWLVGPSIVRWYLLYVTRF
jgi:prepilin signal peptidase PulO-like enzyme (type II secretory pathway)